MKYNFRLKIEGQETKRVTREFPSTIEANAFMMRAMMMTPGKVVDWGFEEATEEATV